MANMSYCRFQNTSQDLQECVSEMEYAVDFSELELSSAETGAMEMMVRLCTSFLEEYERLKEVSE